MCQCASEFRKIFPAPACICLCRLSSDLPACNFSGLKRESNSRNLSPTNFLAIQDERPLILFSFALFLFATLCTVQVCSPPIVFDLQICCRRRIAIASFPRDGPLVKTFGLRGLLTFSSASTLLRPQSFECDLFSRIDLNHTLQQCQLMGPMHHGIRP